MLPSLKKIWRTCFGDDEKYTDMYFDGRFNAGKCIVYTDNGAPCAMTVIYNGKIMRGGKYENAYYIYGVATLAEYRKRGISTRLLEYAKNSVCGENAVLVLAPATEPLIDFYGKRGYVKSFFVKRAYWETENAKAETEKISFLPIDAVQYKQMRDTRFERDGYFAWDTDIIGYALAENEFCGGGACKIAVGGKEYAVMYYVNDDILHVQETTLTDDVLLTALNALARREGCTAVSARLDAAIVICADTAVIAMSDCGDIKNGYMNIIFE